MSRFNQRFFARLDSAAERTGVPAIAEGRFRRRHLRWPPVVAVLLATAGFVLALVRPDLAEPGFALVMLGFAVAVMLPIVGPLKPWGGPDHADEFDQALRTRAFLIGFAVVSFVALAGLWLVIGAAMLTALPREALLSQLRTLCFFLMTLYSALPTLYASWATQPIAEED